MATFDLQLTKSGYIKQATPRTVYTTNSSTWYLVDDTYSLGTSCMLVLGFAAVPDNLKHYALTDVSINFQVKLENVTQTPPIVAYFDAYPVQDFDPTTLTWNTKPAYVPYVGTAVIHTTAYTSSTAAQNIWTTLYSGTSGSDATKKIRAAYSFSRYRCLELSQSAGSLDGYAKTVLTNSAKPVMRFTYDDTAKIGSAVQFVQRPSGTNDNGVAQTVKWKLVKDPTETTYYCAVEVWEQASAKYCWRVQGASSWNEIAVTGTTTQVTVPASTYPTNSTIEYYVQATDEDGHVSNTSTYTFNTSLSSSVTPSNAPTSGYVNPRNATSFGWKYQTAGGTINSGTTTLYWKTSSASEWNTITSSAGANSITVAANTFPEASTIQWYLSGTDFSGFASQTSQYSFTTAAGTVTTDPIAPKNTIVSNNSEITFTWTYSSPDGYAPIRQVFMWKRITDDSWTTLTEFQDTRTTYTAPAYTLPTGELYWCVHPYNIDNVSGVGNSAKIISYGAPETPVVYATETPFMTITWQADDQQAYEIKVGDRTYGAYFGEEKTFTVPDYLEDGNYEVGVRCIGAYGLWSEWGTINVSIQNDAGEDVTLSGESAVDNTLQWETEEETSDFLVYRDGVQIAHTESLQFADRLSVGEHEYYVVNRLTDGNYSKSNELTLTAAMTGNYIAFLSGGDWLQIKYTEPGQNAPDYEESIETVYNHLAGDSFPTAVIGRYRETRMNFSAFFLRTQEEEHQLFRSMFGKPVIMKLRDGTVYIGIIDSWKKQSKTHYHTGYSFTVHRIEWEDYVDDTIPDNPI